MKCPKCGNEKKSYGGKNVSLKVKNGVGIGFVPIYVCLNCKINVNEYQQRLDKVLSKFEKDEEEMRYEILRYIYIYYTSTKKFIIWDSNMNKATKELTLDTVESILKDLEVTNETKI